MFWNFRSLGKVIPQYFQKRLRWNPHQTTANCLVKGLGWWFAVRFFGSFLRRFFRDLGFIDVVAWASEAPKKGSVKLCWLSKSSSSSSSPSPQNYHLQYLTSQQHKLHNIQSKLHTNPTRQRRLFWYLIWCYSEICWHSWQRNAAGDFKCADGAIECDHVGTDILGCCPGWPETASKRLLMPGVNVGTYSPNTRFSCCLLIWKH